MLERSKVTVEKRMKKEQDRVDICVFDVVQGGNYFEEEPIRRNEVEVVVGKLKNRNVAGKDEVTGEKIKLTWW